MSVGRSVGRSVCRSRKYKNEPNQYNKAFSALEAISNDKASAHWSVYGLVTAPAQKHATDVVVYTALFLEGLQIMISYLCILTTATTTGIGK